MADTKITGLLSPQVTTNPATDVLPIVNIADTLMASSGSTRKITVNQLLGAGGTATLASATITGDLTVDTSTLKVDSTNNRVGIGTASPSETLHISKGSAATFLRIQDSSSSNYIGTDTGNFRVLNASVQDLIVATQAGVFTFGDGAGGTRMTLNSTGLGVGVTPSAWFSSAFGPVLQFKSAGSSGGGALTGSGADNFRMFANTYYDSTSQYKHIVAGFATQYEQASGKHQWYTSTTSGALNGVIAFTQAMTLDASGNLLVGPTSGTYHTFRKNLAVDAGNVVFEIQGNGGATSSIYYSVSGYNANAANAASKFGRDATTLRSINAGGTVNASGADYAEYMVKCSDFVLAKGDVAGIDANGKLTNVFADAVSFVVKSTDPSYVGNDKWGVGLEGADLESARQLVDRIAFAGQVPVNVTGAKAGDYIVPVVDGTGIKGISVSKPSFDQYQLAVGKVIAIDADGRARIIVKVA